MEATYFCRIGGRLEVGTIEQFKKYMKANNLSILYLKDHENFIITLQKN